MANDLVFSNDLEGISSDDLNSLVARFNNPNSPLRTIDNETIDEDLKLVDPFTAKATSKVPCTKNWSGIYNFHMTITPNPNQKLWVYSTKMEKVFTNMDVKLPIEFHWLNSEPQLFVRALPVFYSSEWFSYAVTRCLSHEHDKNVVDEHAKHVVRCCDPASLYEIDEESERLSVVTPLIPYQSGLNSVILDYKFMCKNSDVGGMNRRPIFLIFTLERENGQVIGRQTLKIRICSCPRRDREKEENNKYLLADNNIPLESLAGGDKSTSSSEEDHKEETAQPDVRPAKVRKVDKANESDKDKVYQIEVYSHRWYKFFSTLIHDYLVGHADFNNIEFTPTQAAVVEKLRKATEE